MVGTHYIIMYISIQAQILHILVRKEIINPPAHVSFPDSKTIAPPGISFALIVEQAEGIHPALVNIGVQPLPLNRHKSGCFDIFPGPGQVNGVMGRIPVPGHNNIIP